ncbi:MAG: hypothetical protein EHM18_00375 [Acidobacteria bacterium]|nr:MAG: hypothetical protein EHM18_00375 [Acidobacteriota bacterium]
MRTSKTNRRSSWVLLMVFNLAVLIQLVPAYAGPADDRDPDELPFELLQGHLIIVKAFLPGLVRKANLLIDTGATATVVSRDVAEQLSMDRISDGGVGTRASAFGAAIKVERVVLRQLHLGRRVISRPCLAAELPWKEVDILVGLDILRSASLTVDYQKRKVAFGQAFAAGQPVPLEIVQKLIVAPVRLYGLTLRLVVDTGALSPVVHEKRVEAWGQQTLGQKRVKLSHGGGTMKARQVTLPDGQIGGLEFADIVIHILPGEHSNPSIDGFLGPASLGLETIHLDFERQTLYVE